MKEKTELIAQDDKDGLWATHMEQTVKCVET